MAFGWLAVKTGFLGKTVEQGLSAFSLWVAIPALLFRLTSEAEVPEVAPLDKTQNDHVHLGQCNKKKCIKNAN